MKKSIIITIFVAISLMSHSQNLFYYSYDNKIYLKETNCLVVKNNEIQNFKLLVEMPDIKIISSNYVYTLVECLKNRDSLKGDVYPIYKTEDGFLLGCTDELVFSLKKDVKLSAVTEHFPIEILKISSSYVLAKTKSDKHYDILSVSNDIQESGLVVFSHPNFIINVQKHYDSIKDPYFTYQFYLHSVGQLINDGHYTTPDADINAIEAWSITKGNPNIKIAVIDEGVTNNHPDLPSLRQIRLQGSNFAAQYDGSNSDDPSPIGNDNHGNACAGIIGAEHNNEGISGIAPYCKIMPIRIPLGSYPANIYADAIDFAVTNGADIISNSWGYGTSTPNLHPIIVNAIKNATIYGRNNKGAVVVFAAGNTANRISNNLGFVCFPASCGNDTILVVGASDRNNYVANYSPTGDEISVVAPSHKAFSSQMQGEDYEVWSIDIPGNMGYNPNPNNGAYIPNSGINYMSYTGRFGGTSAACPQIAGVSALLLSTNPNFSAIEVKNIIESTTKKIGASNFIFSPDHPNGTWNNEVGYGLVDAYAAVVKACFYGHQIVGDTNVETCQISSFDYEGNLLDKFKIYWKVSPNCAIYSGQLSTHVEVVPLYGDTATLYAYIILNNDTLKIFSKKLSITDYNTNIVTPNLSNGIPLDSVWNTNYTLITSVTVPKGRKLTINADVSCMPHVKIIVENGGRLVINNAEISSHCENILWRGIEVWGAPDTSQYNVSRNVTSPLQGEVVLNNAVIKDAICGVRVGNTRLRNYGKGGGVIKATNTQFVNNKEAVHFNAYIRVSNAHKVVDNISYFNECVFSVDDDAYFIVDTSNVQVSLYNVRGVQFNGCQFEDMQTKSDWQNFGTAIYASQAGFRINEQTDMFQYPATYYNTPCTFNNYKNAIAIVGSAEKPIKIYNTMFYDNSTGVNAKNADALSILSSYFSSGNESFSSYVHGLILDSCNFYRIENNQFTGIGNGIKIIGKTADNNTIRLNTFNSLCKAIEVYGNNGNGNGNGSESNDKIELTGLQFECNEFVTDSTDIYVHGQATIKRTQGSTNHACGNYFGEQSIMHFNNLNTQLPLIYFYNYNVNAQKPLRYNNIDTIGVTHDICGNRHGYIGDSYYDMPKILTDYENLYDANFQLYVSALDNYNSTYEGISIDWNNITAIDETSNPQLFALIQLSELKNSLDETCIEAIHLLGNATEVEITEITTWLQRLSSLNADLLGIHYLAQGNDVSQLQLAWDQITQHYSIVNPEDTSYYQYCINQINAWARDTATDVNISQGAIDTLTAIANSNNTASPYAVSVLECINEHYPWWRLRIHTSCNWTLPIESMSPKKETEQGQTDAIQLHPNPTNGMIEIKSNNLNIKQIELFDIFGKLLMEKKANESTVTLDVSPYAKGMYLLRYTLSDDTQQTKKIIKE